MSNKFIFDDETEAKSERETGLFIKTRQDSTIRRKVTRKKKAKFAILLDGLFICLFQFSYRSFQDICEFNTVFSEWI